MTGKAGKISVTKGFHLSGRNRGHRENAVYRTEFGVEA